MATTVTSPKTSDVVNWAYQYSLASAKLTAAQSAASSSSTRSKDIATAQASFNATMKSLVPSSAQSSVQFQYFDAYSNYNTALASATTEKGRQAATSSLLTSLSKITMPTPTSSTLSQLATDTLTLQKTNVSNAAADIKSMMTKMSTEASNAGKTWVSTVASSASSLNSKMASVTDSVKNLLTKMGVDTSSIAAPTVSTTATSTFAAGTAAAAANGTPGSILNAALIGYLVASAAANTS